MAEWMVGVDTGGTFTDLVAFEPSSGKPRDIGFLVHGTTVATNAVLEGAGVRAGLLITRGFRAVYEARGWVQPEPGELFDPFFRKPPLLIPQSRTEEISERLDYQGKVIEPLDESCVQEAAQRLT